MANTYKSFRCHWQKCNRWKAFGTCGRQTRLFRTSFSTGRIAEACCYSGRFVVLFNLGNSELIDPNFWCYIANADIRFRISCIFIIYKLFPSLEDCMEPCHESVDLVLAKAEFEETLQVVQLNIQLKILYIDWSFYRLGDLNHLTVMVQAALPQTSQVSSER